MKKYAIIGSTLILFFISACTSRTERKFDKKQVEMQKQEAIEMIKKSHNVKIDRGLGKDKIIIED